MSEAGYVLAEDIELEVDDASYADVLKVGVLKRVGDDCHLETVLGGVADGERYAVDGDRPFVDGEVAPLRFLSVEVIAESEVGAAVSILHSGTAGC